jgi:hypothetical protein
LPDWKQSWRPNSMIQQPWRLSSRNGLSKSARRWRRYWRITILKQAILLRKMPAVLRTAFAMDDRYLPIEHGILNFDFEAALAALIKAAQDYKIAF